MNAMAPGKSFWERHGLKILLFVLLAFGIHDVFGAHGFLAMRRTEKDMARLRGDLTRLDRENDELAKQVKSLKTDPKAIERIAREMGMARPGELIFKLPAPAGKPSADSNPR